MAGKPIRRYHVSDTTNGLGFTVYAKSVSHAASLSRRAIARTMREKYKPWKTDSETGGWIGVSIHLPECVHASASKPTPRPESPKKLWKNKVAT
jgi:hypothetical protein